MNKTHEQLLECSDNDKAFFNECVKGLPTRKGFLGNYTDKYGIEIPYGSEAHIVQHLRKAVEIVKPKLILEIGFNCGWSAAIWLNICNAGLVSIDISDKEETLVAAEILKNRFTSRFYFKLRKDFIELVRNSYDLIFIDGDHRESFIVDDINLAKDLNIPYILFDDCYERYGETMAALNHFPDLELVHDMDNLKLYKWIKK